ncbi:uncharacterized protein METZ01_LOCUS226250, partial [marine metagenome]
MENTILVGIITQAQGIEKSNDYLDELDFLTITAGGKVLKRFVQKMNMPNPKTFIGSGKISEIKEYIEANDINTVIFDDELSPTQERNISKIFN